MSDLKKRQFFNSQSNRFVGFSSQKFKQLERNGFISYPNFDELNQAIDDDDWGKFWGYQYKKKDVPNKPKKIVGEEKKLKSLYSYHVTIQTQIVTISEDLSGAKKKQVKMPNFQFVQHSNKGDLTPQAIKKLALNHLKNLTLEFSSMFERGSSVSIRALPNPKAIERGCNFKMKDGVANNKKMLIEVKRVALNNFLPQRELTIIKADNQPYYFLLGDDRKISLGENLCAPSAVYDYCQRNELKTWDAQKIKDWFNTQLKNKEYVGLYESSSIASYDMDDDKYLFTDITYKQKPVKDISEGVPIELFFEWFRQHKINWTLVDLQGKLFSMCNQFKATNYPPFYGKFTGNHIIPINNEALRKQIKVTKEIKSVKPIFNPSLKKIEIQNIMNINEYMDDIDGEEEVNVIASGVIHDDKVSETMTHELFINYLKALRKMGIDIIPENMFKVRHDITYFTLGKCHIYINDSFGSTYDTITKVMKDEKCSEYVKDKLMRYLDPKNNSNLFFLFGELCDVNFKSLQSKNNKRARSFLMGSTLHVSPLFNIPENVLGFIYDTIKNHSYLMTGDMFKYGWCIYTCDNEVREYNGKDKIDHGFYFVNKTVVFIKDKMVCPPAAWPDDAVNFMLKEKLIEKSDITHYLAPSKFANKDILKTTIATIYDTFKDKPKMAKLICNMAYGVFGKKTQDIDKYYLCYDFMQAIAFSCGYGKSYSCLNDLDSKDEMYLLRERSEKTKFEHYLPFFLKINAMTWILQYKKWLQMKECGAKAKDIVRIRVDAICLKERNKEFEKKYCGKNMGDCYLDDKEFTKQKYVANLPEYDVPKKKREIKNITKNNMFDLIDNNKGFLVTGRAGTGKSTLAKKICDYLKEKHISFVVTSLSHIATNNIKRKCVDVEACTLAKLLVGHVNASEETRLKEVANKYEVIIVDEFSMITLEYYEKMHKIKQMNNSIKFIMLGDKNQCVAPEESALIRYGMDILHELTDFNVLTLTEIYRYKDSQGLKEACDLLLDQGKLSKSFLVSDKIISKKIPLSLCFTKKTVKKINDKYNEKYKNIDGSLEIRKDFFIIEGAYVISKKNHNDLGINNNQLLRVVSYDQHKINFVDICDETIIIELTKEQAKNNLLLGHAVTIHRSQGLTLTMNYFIRDIQHKRANKELIYTAITRAKKIEQIYFDYEDYEKLFFKNHENNLSVVECQKYHAKNSKEFMNSILYKLVDKKGNVKYVGSTIDEERRKEEHKESADKSHLTMIKICDLPWVKSTLELVRHERDAIQYYLSVGCDLMNKILIKKKKKIIVKPYVFENINEITEEDFVERLSKCKRVKELKTKKMVRYTYYVDGKRQRKDFRYKQDKKEAISKLAEWLIENPQYKP